MGAPASFEVFSYSYIKMWVRCWDCSLVYNISLVTVSSEGTIVFFGGLAVAWFVFGCFSFSILEDLLIVGLDNLLDIGCATIGNLQGVFVQDWVKPMVLGKCFRTRSRKILPSLVLSALLKGGV